MWLSSAQHGKDSYIVSEYGAIISGRDRGVKEGDLRVFWWTDRTLYDTPVVYVADRIFKSIIPFRSPIVWWRRLELNERLVELETFVDKCASVKNLEGWQRDYFIEAKELSKKGFLNKLKGEKWD